MSSVKVVFIFITIQAIFSPRALVLGDLLPPLSPLLSPFVNGICDAVQCGKGSCEVSLNQTFGFICKCNSGWNQFHVFGDHFRFLPCIIPNCSINYSCSNDSRAPASAPAPALASPPPPSNLSLFDPCTWAFCGGGKCSMTSTYEHKCECNEGFGNLFNVTIFPCFHDCSLGADCSNLGLNISNSSSSGASPPSLTDNGKSSYGGDPLAPKDSLRLLVLLILLAIN